MSSTIPPTTRTRHPSLGPLRTAAVPASPSSGPTKSRTNVLGAQLRALTRGWLVPKPIGRVLEMAGTIIQIEMTGASTGDVLAIESEAGEVLAEVVGFRDGKLLAVPLQPVRRLAPGAAVRLRGAMSTIPVGTALLGRTIDPFGLPLDGLPMPACNARIAIDRPAIPVDERDEVLARFDTGVRVIDGVLTCGRGQRVGIFAGAGCGKSVLVEQIANQAEADVIVIGLIGERGREVRDLLNGKRREKTIIVAATADRSPLERVRGALAATAVAEHFRDRGKNVLLILDSLTRFAMALREVGLALGEPPATKGYPPSVFATLPRLLERVAPRAGGGAITGFFTVLVEGDDMADPVADSAKSLLDAHIVLSRELAGRGHFPAIDVLPSASRVANKVASATMRQLAANARGMLARRHQAQELQALGAYTPGANAVLDNALALGERFDTWARQTPSERSDIEATIRQLAAALGESLIA